MFFAGNPGEGMSLQREVNILVVDPEREIRFVIATRLESEGMKCLHAESMAEALTLLEQSPVQAIVSEVILPDASNFELLDELTKRKLDIPVIYLTAWGNVELAKRAIRNGAFDYYDKPVDLKTLSATLQRAVRNGGHYSGPERRQAMDVTVQQPDPTSRDELTGLASHRFLLEKLSAIHKECCLKNRPLSLCLIDIDDFREHNNREGLNTGDKLLIEAAHRLKNIVRTNDIVGRYGADEFILVLPGATKSAAEKLSQRIMQNFEQEKWQIDHNQIKLSLCIGIAEINQEESTTSVDLIERAVEAIHHAKLRGPGSFVSWQPQLMKERPFNVDFGEGKSHGADVESITVMMWRFRELNRRLSSVTLESLRLLVAAVEARDPYTKHHSVRVASFARYLAGELELPESQIRSIHSAALLHDIGKIGVPDAILTKPGRLTPEERDLIMQHPTIAVNILEQARFFLSELPLVKHHHEWYNGQGYPDKIGGLDIPLGSRIIHVADATEAMFARRSYKNPYDIEHTIRQLRDGAGKQFDPSLSNLAIRIIRDGILQQLWRGRDDDALELELTTNQSQNN
jgi:diguanylate cyclase (GGDEF)-like protein/putative nucleotidyltransferase with HDIG domain